MLATGVMYLMFVLFACVNSLAASMDLVTTDLSTAFDFQFFALLNLASLADVFEMRIDFRLRPLWT